MPPGMVFVPWFDEGVFIPVPDSQLGLSKASVFDVPEPGAYTYSTAEPGGNNSCLERFRGRLR
jgi:hypothetical protein